MPAPVQGKLVDVCQDLMLGKPMSRRCAGWGAAKAARREETLAAAGGSPAGPQLLHGAPHDQVGLTLCAACRSRALEGGYVAVLELSAQEMRRHGPGT